MVGAPRTLGSPWGRMVGRGSALCLSLCLLVWCGASASPDVHQRQASVFADLSAAEILAVRNFLLAQKHLNLSTAQTQVLARNHIFLIELWLPKKQQVLDFLVGHVCPPRRKARVIVFFGGEPSPNVTEYIVGPLPRPRYFYPFFPKGSKPPRFSARPVTAAEYHLIRRKLALVTEAASPLLREISGFWFHNCTDHCLTFTDVAPRGERSGDRKSWFILQRKVEGCFLHPIGIEIQLNHESLDTERWRVEKVWYNGQYFDSVEELVDKCNRGLVAKVKLPDLGEGDLFSSYTPRGPLQPPVDAPGPKAWEPGGRRYRVKGNSVLYAGWSFAFRVRTSSGIQLFDIRFNGEPIAYEVSLQEAIAFYAGHSPAMMQTKYIDTAWGMGVMAHEMAKGIDCPDYATYTDIYHLYDSDRPVHYRNALCVFEHNTAVPLRRHFSNNFRGAHHFYAGVQGQVLVLRTTSTVFNYDYLWDFIFHQNGVIEVKVHLTGYIHASFYTAEGLTYGYRLQTHLLGNLHTHLLHYKVDLDVAGTNNSFETLEVMWENTSDPRSPGRTLLQPRLHRVPRQRERSAAFPFRKPLPRYLIFYNPHQRNKWQSRRAYRIQLNSHADRVLPRAAAEEKGISWARYQISVTRLRDEERCSSSLYVQNDPWDPDVSFESFLRNNDHLFSQDLVAWVTVGFLHIPHAEDIPNTSTPGNAVGFFIRPFNYFHQDPSVASRDVVIVRPTTPSVSGVKVERWTVAAGLQCPATGPFTYNGTYLPV